MNANRNLTTHWQDDQALDRYKLISPLLEEGLDDAARIQKRRKLAQQNGLSDRTLKRYLNAYQASGFHGLRPRARSSFNSETQPENFSELVSEAIQLRREVPSRSVDKIITILELEGKVKPGVLKRSTLQRHLYKAGYGAEHLEIYKDAQKSSSRRYCKPHRMMLIQGDIKEGIYLPIGKDGAKKKTYLSSAIDDHSRMILFSKFYDNEEASIVEDTFHKAILNYGHFDRAYFDNGSQYIARQLKQSLEKLSIRISFAPVQSGKSKGKIEKFHQVVSQYLDEAKAKKIKTLDELNRYWTIYLEEYYQNEAHDGIREYYRSQGVDIPEQGISPLQEFNRDSRPLTFIDTAVVNEAFLHHEIRKVDKGGCFSFHGKQYEAKTSLIGCKVEIAYDPGAPDIVTVHYPGTEPFETKPIRIDAYVHQSPGLPETKKTIVPETSRFLDALEKQHAEAKKRQADAISFGAYWKEGASDV